MSFVSHSPSVARYVRTPPAAVSHILPHCSHPAVLVVCWMPHQDRRLLLNYQHLFESEAKVLLGSITIYNNRLPVFNKYLPHCVFKSSFVQSKSFECVVQPDSLPESCGIQIR